jgi:hypothetical protein
MTNTNQRASFVGSEKPDGFYCSFCECILNVHDTSSVILFTVPKFCKMIGDIDDENSIYFMACKSCASQKLSEAFESQSIKKSMNFLVKNIDKS